MPDSLHPSSLAGPSSISSTVGRSTLFRDPRNPLSAKVSVRARAMGDDGAKAAATTGIKQITRLRELLHKWGLGARQPEEEEEESHGHGVVLDDDDVVASSIPPFVLRRLRRAETVDSLLSDDESCHSPEPPPDVPRGYCPVYVGPEQRRFVIPTSYLAHPVFRLLLEKAEEEFGFRHEGALAIPCETEAFKYILQCVERHDKGLAADVAANHPAMSSLEREEAASAMHHP